MNRPQTYLVYGLGTPIKITGRLNFADDVVVIEDERYEAILVGSRRVITIIKAESIEE
tara:strand:- start:4244 stop:4417 length:174 start_codon:yes stop_codon:yes gene_type:complete